MERHRKPQRYHFEIQSSELERRDVPASSTGNTFAILPGEIASSGQSAAIKVNVTKDLFTLPKGRALIGVAVAPTTDNTVSPQISSVTNDKNQNVGASEGGNRNQASIQAAVQNNSTKPSLFNVRLNRRMGSASYQVNVTDSGNNAGGFLSGFYLPGDASGDLKVDRNDVAAIKSLNGTTASDAAYNFNADSNRDGIINHSDVRIARQNIGVAVKVQPVITARLDPASDSGDADRITDIRDVTFQGIATPGSTITYTEVSNKIPPVSTTTDASGNYSLVISLGDGINTFRVTSVDTFGQSISGTLSPVTYQQNPPGNTTT
ncbi:MAG: hypothetical protein RJA81_2327 [Planctomycetota bacterium]